MLYEWTGVGGVGGVGGRSTTRLMFYIYSRTEQTDRLLTVWSSLTLTSDVAQFN